MGLVASANGGHREIWARDAMISVLGAILVNDDPLKESLRASIRTLRDHQTPLGGIPNHVDPATGAPNFRAYADGGLWYVIGSTLLGAGRDLVEPVLRWYEYQDVDNSGLLSMQEASAWLDLFAVRGKTLYLNCLYVAALRCAGMTRKADQVSGRINELLWYRGDGQMLRHLAHSFSTQNHSSDSLGRKRVLPSKRILVEEAYYLPYLSFRDVGEWFDTFGHLLAILAGVADEAQTASILDFIERHGIAELPAKAIWPAVEEGDPDWRPYYGSVNVPYHYHNAGAWPFLGGFYVAALVHAGRLKDAAAALERLARLNLAGEFNEWHHGQSGEPMGVRRQAWSAGMYLYAYECLAQGEALFFRECEVQPTESRPG